MKNVAISLQKLCNIIQNVTHMDVRLISTNAEPLLQLVWHEIPPILQNTEDDYAFILEKLKQNSQNSFFYFIAKNGLEYLATGIWKSEQDGFVLVGPFLSKSPGSDFISDVLSEGRLPISERKQLQSFYQSLPRVPTIVTNSLGEILVNLCGRDLIQANMIIVEAEPLPIENKEKMRSDLAESKEIIFFRYKNEKILMDVITKGARATAEKLLNEVGGLLNIPERTPENPLRSTKNLLIVLNTLCRIAAEKGGLTPVHVHVISEKFAIMIERASSSSTIKKLFQHIIFEYCDAVIEYSMQGYSPSVKKVADHIMLNLELPLTLNELSTVVSVSPSHLSRIFKSETGMSMTDYINLKRIEESKPYLLRGNLPITEIALMVGFNDLNYFGRVFKKIMGVKPSEYAKHELSTP